MGVAYLNSEQKKAVKSTILECRGILQKDIERVLINLGIYINEEWVEITSLTNLNEEQRKIRENIEQVIEKLCEGGFEKNKAIEEYIKEVAYTYLNRVAALRVLEVRGLIEEILISRPENGDKSFINSRFYEVAREYCKYNMDAGLAYIINLMFEEIGEEIKLLFNTEDEFSFIAPSSNGLLSIIKLLCTDIDEESWKQDEIIGWIYQYFNEKEKEDVFDRLYNKKEKIKVEDIPAATQLFTPNWIVEWIVNNSLGILWQELKDGKRQGKKIEEIKLLDPCCGSGHFLVKAYDLFYQMYIEEGIYSKEEIPFMILHNNIHGIDIDLRAVQLTGLILYIKAKTSLKNNNCEINTKGKVLVNLVCADAILLNGSRLRALEEKHKNNKTILEMIKIIYDEFKDVRLKGSLIQPERKLFPLFEEFKNRIAKSELIKANKNKKKQEAGQGSFIEEKVLSLEEYKSKRDYTKEEKKLMDSLNSIYSEATKANDISRQLFASEAVKSIKLVDVFMKQYDVVITNPPYMGKTSMNEKLKEFINLNYKGYENDLYSAFIIRCHQFLGENGIMGMITQESFMFISSYNKFREHLLDVITIKSLVHLGPHAFEDISGQKVSTCMFTFEKKQTSMEDKGVYIKLNDINKAEDKRRMLADIQSNKYLYGRVFKVEQGLFKLIDGNPFIYGIPERLKNILMNNKTLNSFAAAKTGINTGKNDKFVRFWWEIRDNTSKKIVPYAKGGGATRFCGGQDNVVWWDPEEMKKHSGCRLMNQDLFFKEGLTFSGVNSQRFAVRYLPKGFIFDSGGSFIDVKNTNLYYLLGYLNTKLVNYYLNLFNPTINFKNNDIHRLPFIYEENIVGKVEENILNIIGLKKEIIKQNETNKSFESNYLVKKNYFNIKEYILNMTKLRLEYFNKIDINDEIFNALYELDNDDISLIENLETCSDTEIREKLIEIGEIDAVSKKMKVKESNVAKVKLSSEIVTSKEEKQVVTNLISYFIGCLFNRWSMTGVKSNIEGIIPMNASIYLEKDLVEKIYECITLAFGEDNTDVIFDDIERILEMSLEEYLKTNCSNEHINNYKKRPIYWHIRSPKKTFNCFVYYHKLDEDTLYKVKSMYLAKMIERYEEDLKYYNEQLIKSRIDNDKNKEKDFKIKCSDLEQKLEDLNILDKSIMSILPYKPDLDQGVLYNIIPMESILAARVSTDKERQEYYKEVKKK